MVYWEGQERTIYVMCTLACNLPAHVATLQLLYFSPQDTGGLNLKPTGSMEVRSSCDIDRGIS